MDNQTRGGHIPVMLPSLDVAEPGEPLAAHRYHSLGLVDFLNNVFRFSLGDAGPSDLGSIFYRPENLIHKLEVFLRSHLHCKFWGCHVCLSVLCPLAFVLGHSEHGEEGRQEGVGPD